MDELQKGVCCDQSSRRQFFHDTCQILMLRTCRHAGSCFVKQILIIYLFIYFLGWNQRHNENPLGSLIRSTGLCCVYPSIFTVSVWDNQLLPDSSVYPSVFALNVIFACLLTKAMLLYCLCFIPWLCFRAAGCKYLIEINETTQYFMTSHDVLLGCFIFFEDIAGQFKADSSPRYIALVLYCKRKNVWAVAHMFWLF